MKCISFIPQYSADEMGGHGGGGEYDIQVGFGWTNGVILELLAEYGNRLSTPGSKNNITES